jgi:hypothetical protein
MSTVAALLHFSQIISGQDVNLPLVNPTGFFPTAITIASQIIGAVSFLIIVLAGLRYAMSMGDPQKTAQAKDAIIYAAVGLALSLGAYAIVTFVITKT